MRTKFELISFMCTFYKQEMTDELIEVYTKAFEGLDDKILNQAVDRCMGDSNWLPKPKEIKQAYHEVKRELTPKSEEPAHHYLDAYQCPTCRDTGMVTIWSAQTVREALLEVKGGRPMKHFYTQAAACTCKAGNKFSTITGRYDPDTHVRSYGCGQASIERLRQWCRESLGIAETADCAITPIEEGGL